MIIDKDQNPIEGAKVELHSDVITQYTDNQGTTQFNDIPAGKHKIKIAYGKYKGEKEIDLSGDQKIIKIIIELHRQAWDILIIVILAILLLLAILVTVPFPFLLR